MTPYSHNESSINFHHIDHCATLRNATEMGPGEKKGQKNTGVNRTLILAHGEGWSENHSNLRTIVQLLNLEEVEFALAADLKLLNIFLGLSSHSGKHACLYCEGTMGLEAGVPRTFSRIITQHADYEAGGAIKADMAKFANCVRPCLMTVPDPTVSVLSVIPIPELHVMMGCTNHQFNLLKKLMAAQGRLEQLFAWCRRCSITLRGEGTDLGKAGAGAGTGFIGSG